MIESVEIRYLKQFSYQEFDLTPVSVLAGPNNSGKTTLLQALMVWNLAMQKWWERKGPLTGSRASKRTGAPITRQEFNAMPLPSMDQLWTDLHTSYRKNERSGRKPGTPRLLEVNIKTKTWQLGFELRCSGPEQIYVAPKPYEWELIKQARDELTMVYIPPFSGIGVQETRYDRPYQDMLIGQGKAGDIVRNLLYEIAEEKDSDWDQLARDIDEIFGYELLKPAYSGAPYIDCRYRKGRGRGLPQLDISTAGSGFHQTVLILAFLYARPAAVVLMDEPDAHLHVVLQKGLNDRLRSLIRHKKGQLIVATHSEVFINAAAPESILSFYGTPHRLATKSDRDRIPEALKRIKSMEELAAAHSAGVLYVEGESDFNLLKAWARVLAHPLSKWFDDQPFWIDNRGSNPREARGHFFALLSIQPRLKGVLLLDGDNKAIDDHEITAEGLTVLRWERYEAESYLLHPAALERFLSEEVPPLFLENAENAIDHLKRFLPPVFFDNPLDTIPFLKSEPASKSLLPEIFDRAQLNITKPDYYQLAERMQPSEIPPEVTDKLDAVYAAVGGNR